MTRSTYALVPYRQQFKVGASDSEIVLESRKLAKAINGVIVAHGARLCTINEAMNAYRSRDGAIGTRDFSEAAGDTPSEE